MVCVGDSTDIFLFDISTSGSFHHQATFTASDSSFSTAFSPTSSIFAVASGNGIISIWDRRFARNVTPLSRTGRLAALKTSRPGLSTGASRCVTFSEGPIDLIMFTEQKDYVHLVDARTFEKRQILRLGEMEDTSREPDIGGACFSPDGKNVIIANERTIFQWVFPAPLGRFFPFILSLGMALMSFLGRKSISGDENCFRASNCIDIFYLLEGELME
jgi:WD40 repeat protein